MKAHLARSLALGILFGVGIWTLSPRPWDEAAVGGAIFGVGVFVVHGFGPLRTYARSLWRSRRESP